MTPEERESAVRFIMNNLHYTLFNKYTITPAHYREAAENLIDETNDPNWQPKYGPDTAL